ncbi:hypothetical protein CPC08DRAFT_196199 [Agrocybe pediades]|nr:hypothetical protein CPC08DRAFT_196199 [Agrocybe pediades]
MYRGGRRRAGADVKPTQHASSDFTFENNKGLPLFLTTTACFLSRRITSDKCVGSASSDLVFPSPASDRIQRKMGSRFELLRGGFISGITANLMQSDKISLFAPTPLPL